MSGLRMTPARLRLLREVANGLVHRSESIGDLYQVYTVNSRNVTKVAETLRDAGLIDVDSGAYLPGRRLAYAVVITDAGRAVLAEAGEQP